MFDEQKEYRIFVAGHSASIDHITPPEYRALLDKWVYEGKAVCRGLMPEGVFAGMVLYEPVTREEEDH